MHNHKLLSLLVLGGLALTIGCEKKPPEDVGTQVVDYGNPKQNFRLGIDLLAQGETSGTFDYEGAYKYFYNATMGDPTFAKAHFNAGWCAEHLGRMPEAEEHFRQALANAAGYTQAAQSLAGVLSVQGKTTEAIDIYQGFLRESPGANEVRAGLVDALIVARRYDEAILEARQILARNKDSISAYTALARIYYLQGQYDMSLLCSQKALTLTDTDASIYNATGVTYLKLGNEPAAIAQFKTSIKLQPSVQDANMNLGWLALDSGDYELGKRCFEAIITQNPGNIDALLGLAVSQRGLKDFDGAGATYDKVIKLAPDNELAYFNAATLHEKYTQNYKKALSYLQAFVDTHVGKIGPDHEVYVRMERVKRSQQEQEAKEAEKARQEELRKEREKKQKEQLELLKARTAKLEANMAKYGSCPALIESGMAEMGATVLEQAKMVVEQNDFAMATDMMSFFDQVEPEIEAVLPSCAEAAPPAPETPAPAPAPETPAPDAPAPVEAPAAPAPAPADEVPVEATPPGEVPPVPAEDTPAGEP
jgi:tetratricopeptide (TPR) repeat protein